MRSAYYREQDGSVSRCINGEVVEDLSFEEWTKRAAIARKAIDSVRGKGQAPKHAKLRRKQCSPTTR